MNSTLTFVVALLSGLVLSGCWDTGTQGSTPTPPDGGGGNGQIQINAQNQNQVARLAFNATDIRSIGNIAAQGVTSGALPPADQPCAAGGATAGTVSFSLNDLDHDGAVGPGDIVTATFNGCRIDPNDLATGTVTMTVVSQTSTPFVRTPPWTVSMSMAFNKDFQIQSNTSGTITASGTINFTVSASDSHNPNNLSGTFSSASSFVFTSTQPADTQTLNNLSFTFTSTSGQTTTTGNGYTESGTGTVSSTALNGSINFTISNLGGADADFPNTGSMTITGANSSLTLTPLDANNVTLEIKDVNGTVINTSQVLWTQI